MNSAHVPVLMTEVLAQSEVDRDLKSYLDCTFGRGGHLKALEKKYRFESMVAFDRDAQAVEHAEEEFRDLLESKKLEFHHANFFEAKRVLDRSAGFHGPFDLILVDLGISSPQVDQPDRGFSFIKDGPLDMRMDVRQPVKAADIVNGWAESELIELFRELGEVDSPFRVVRAIVADRKSKPFETTLDLAGLIERVDGRKGKGHHPATKYFLALRMQVNSELSGLKEAIHDLISLLSIGGRILVITFHSLEDRIVKQVFNSEFTSGRPVNKRVIEASDSEQKKNSRSRSAKLRVFERTAEPYVREKKNKYAHKKGE